jgi:hypothetical protein
MKTIKNNAALLKQYNRILSKHPNYKIKYVDKMRNGDEAKSYELNTTKSSKNTSYTEIYRAGLDSNLKPVADLKYVIMHEFGHIWSSISGYRAENYSIYGEYSSMPVWLDEIYADLYANYWGKYPLDSQSYIINMMKIKGSRYYERGEVIFPNTF